MTDEESDDGQETCPACKKVVYFGERAPLFLTKIYHKRCFRCSNCSNLLQAGRFLDHEEKPFCENCYRKKFVDNVLYSPSTVVDPERGEIDRSNPLEGIKGKNGRLDVKRYSELHHLDAALSNAYTQHKKFIAANKQEKVYGYMLGNDATMLMEERLKFVDEQVRNRIHQLIKTQMKLFETRLMKHVDLILDQELANAGATRRFDEDIFQQKKVDAKKQHLMTSLAKEFESVQPEDLMSHDIEEKTQTRENNFKQTNVDFERDSQQQIQSKKLFQNATNQAAQSILSLIDDEDEKGYESEDTADLLSKLAL